MRKLLVALLVLVVGFGAVIAAAMWFVRTDDLRARLEREIETQLGRETKVGALELSLFPRPAVNVRELWIAGETPRVAPLAEVDSVRLRLAVLPLLAGRVKLASLTIERPRIVLPLDAAGRPILPRAKDAPASAARAERPAAGETATPVANEGESPAAGAALFAIDAFHVRDGSARVGRYSLEKVDLDGALRSGGRAEVEGSFELPETARVSDVEVEIEGLGAPEQTALASARAQGDLGAVARMARLGKGYDGKFDLEVSDLRLVNYQPTEGKISGRLHDLAVRLALTAVDGEAKLDADATGRWKLDLADAEFRYGDMKKPRGTPLALEGPFPEAVSQRLAGRLILPGNAIDFVADYKGGDIPTLSLGPGTLALEPLAPLLGIPISGKVNLVDPRLLLGPPPMLGGQVTLEDVSHPIGATAVSASGDLRLQGHSITGKALRAHVADQPFDVSMVFALGGPWLDLKVRGSELDVEKLAAGLVASRDIGGTAKLETNLRGSVQGEQTLSGLDGNGRIEIAPGRIRGFSILRQTFGELAALPLAVGVLRGKDFSRYEEDEFQSLTADYFVHGGKLVTENLKIVYRNATADLAGEVGLADGALRLHGQLLLAREVDAELGAAPGGKPRVIPIAGIGGTVSKPRIELGQDAVVAIGAAITGSDRIKEKLDEKLGEGAGEAVEGVLDLLRGEKQPDPAP